MDDVSQKSITASKLGSQVFKKKNKCKYAYYAGSMYKGISSAELVISMGKAGHMSFLGTGGMRFNAVEDAIKQIQQALGDMHPFGVNVLCNFGFPQEEEKLIDLLLKNDVSTIEASAFMQVMPSLVRYRLNGIKKLPNGQIHIPNQIIAKVSRPEVAEQFMRPAPQKIIQSLLQSGAINQEQAQLAEVVPVAQFICVEADSGGHTDMGVAMSLLPSIQALASRVMKSTQLVDKVEVGLAGGLGTPTAIAAAFVMGAAFVATGSVNQCTVEAGTSEIVKDMLQEIDVQDTAYAPAGDMFELGAKIQVVRKGCFFPARANKLYELYQRFEGLEHLDGKTKEQLEKKYFKRSIDSVWEETRAYYEKAAPKEIEKALGSPKHKMVLIFKWYFVHTTRLSLEGQSSEKVNFQIHSGPALGAFNQLVKGTELENWRSRRVSQIAEYLMVGAAKELKARVQLLTEVVEEPSHEI